MSPLDILIVVVLAAFMYLGYVTGFIVQVTSFVGLFLGVAVAARIDLHFLIPHTQTNLTKALCIVIVIALGGGLFLFGEWLGSHYRVKILGTKLFKPDRYFGIFAGFVFGLVMLSIGISYSLNNSSINAQNTVLESKIFAYANTHSLLGHNLNRAFYLVDPNFSTLGVGQTSADSNQLGLSIAKYDLPTQGPFITAINKDYKSVVLIEWDGCGGLHFGSGYVAAPNVVVTAAHVVTGAGLVKINDTIHSYVGTVILFDGKKDLAAIYVPGLSDPSLKLNTNVQPNNTQTVLLGYKEAGPLTDGVGPIFSYSSFASLHANVNNDVKISGSTLFYGVKAPSNHGDSGGPLISSDGSVLGHLSFVDFETADNQPSTGGSDGNFSYFVAVSNYAQELSSVEKSQTRVATGTCLNFTP